MLDMKRGLSSTLGLVTIAATDLGPAYVSKIKRAGSKNGRGVDLFFTEPTP